MQTSTSKSNSSKASTMADLMKTASSSLVTPKKGAILEGKITKLTSAEILVDINAKTEAVVMEKDRNLLKKLLSMLKVGDKVSVQILNPESDTGNSVVSLRRFIDDIVWKKLDLLLKNQEPLGVVVDMSTKGGFLVTAKDGVSGFLPTSHISGLDGGSSLVGKTIKVVLLEINRPMHKIIFSQRKVLSVKDFQTLVKELAVGQQIDSIITNVANFGIFVSIPLKEDPIGFSRSPSGSIRTRLTEQSDGAGKFAEGFIHISEASWENIPDIFSKFKAGDKIKTVILDFDRDARRVNLSIKRLENDPFEQKLDEFTVDKKLKATVMKIISTGVLLDLGDNITGIIKKEKIPVKTTYEEGMALDVTVSSIDKKRHRVEVAPVLKEKPIGYR